MESNKKLIKDEMSHKIVESAEKIIVEKGIEYLNVSRILRELNITNRVFYNRFNNIQDVLVEIHNKIIIQKRELISIEYDESIDFFEYGTNLATSFLELAYDLQEKFNFFIFGSDIFTNENYEWYLSKIKELLKIGRERDLLKDFDDEAMSYYIWCSCRGINTDIVTRMGKDEAVKLFKSSFRYLLEGIKK